MKCLSVFLIFSFTLSTVNAISFADKPLEDPFVIKKLSQRLEFFMDRKTLKARLQVTVIVESKKLRPTTYKRPIFIDNNSQIENMKYGRGRAGFKIEPLFSDYQSSGIFHSDLKLSLFEFGLSKDDGPLYLTYTKVYHDIKFLDPLYFVDAHPVEESTITVVVPEWLDLDLKTWNFDREDPALSVETKKRNRISTYSLKNVVGASSFERQPNRNQVNAHLIPIVKSFVYKGDKVRVMQDAGDLYNWYASLVMQMKDNPKVLKERVEELTKGKKTDEEKIKAIFYWVQDNIRYIAFEYGIMGFKPEDCQSVYEQRYGDCKGMANLTKQMLLLAGYDARLTWIGTKDLPYSYDIPSLLVDNHMICTVMLEGEKVYLDATEKYSDYKTYAQRIQGKQVMIEDGSEYIIDEVPTTDYDANCEYVRHALRIESSGDLIGTGSIRFTGSNKSMMLYRLSTLPSKEWSDAVVGYIGKGDKNVMVELKEEPDLEVRDQDFALKYDIQVANHITNIGNEMYLAPDIDFQFKSLDMAEDRIAPYQFASDYLVDYEVVLDIPAGWKVDYLPAAVEIDGGDYSFSLSYAQSENKIIYTKKLSLTKDILEVNEFENWNKEIKQIKEFYEDQIILSK